MHAHHVGVAVVKTRGAQLRLFLLLDRLLVLVLVLVLRRLLTLLVTARVPAQADRIAPLRVRRVATRVRRRHVRSAPRVRFGHADERLLPGGEHVLEELDQQRVRDGPADSQLAVRVRAVLVGHDALGEALRDAVQLLQAVEIEVRVVDGVVFSGVVHVGNLGYVVPALARVVNVLLEFLPPRVHEEERLAARGDGPVLELAEASLGHGPARGGRGEGVHPRGGGR